MNIALIYTDKDHWALGMRSVSAVLKRAGHKTRLLMMGSMESLYTEEILNKTKDLVKNFEIIGISSLSRGSEKAKQVIGSLQILGQIVVWGGVHATLNPEECASFADIVCVGEGEGFILELANKIKMREDWKQISNAAYKKNGHLVVNDLRPLIINLDELPVMDFTREDEFHLKNGMFIQAEKAYDKTEPIMFTGSRGCALHCNYCSNSKLKKLFSGKGRYVRKMSVSEYVNQAESLKKQFPKSKYFYLVDEDFFARKKEEIQKFSERWREQVGLPFECMASPIQISEEKMAFLVRAGIWRVDMGVESGSERTKKEIYNRPISNDSVLQAARIINKYSQVIPYYFLIIGNPYEERKDLLETIHFIEKLPTNFYLRTYNLIFLPGTLLYEFAVRDGIIDGKKDSGYEIDFLAGLKFEGHAWKTKNLYLNGLLYLMTGKNTAFRLGLIPRSLLKILTAHRILNFNEKHTAVIKFLIMFKTFTLKFRSYIAYLVKKLLKDPTSVYNLRLGSKKSISVRNLK
jgi:radical SAM superfamily enzyme YgiQ (UPF0313 family)